MMDITINALSKSFGENVVFENFNAVIKGGTVTYIKAPSGTGKTTLLRILMGLLPTDSGEIKGLADCKISTVFQEDRLVENLSAVTNIRIVSDISLDEIEAILCDMGLENFTKAACNTLSGGMRRRVAIARALSVDFDVLLLDEPFKGIDEKMRDKLANVIRERTRGKTVILVSHSDEEAELLQASERIDL